MRDKICLVTGANSGIGKAAARGLARMGATVVLLCRDREKGEEARNEIGRDHAHLLVADLSSLEEIRRIAREFGERYGRLDVLVNNAGVYLWDRALSVDGVEMTFAVNHLAYFLLTHLLLDALKVAAPSRIINVSSIVHRWGRIDFDDLEGERGYTGARAYDQSKLANLLFTLEMARRLEGTAVVVNSMEPGGVRTNFFRDFRGFRRLLVRIGGPFLRSPEKGAETILHLAASPDVEGVTGGHFARCRQVRPSRRARDPAVASRLWEVSREMTGVS